MILLRFALSAIAIVAAGIAAARFGDIIAVRSRLGEFLFGTVLLAAATSLPELVAGFDAVRLGIPDLAAGNMLGSIMINMLFLGVFDVITLRPRLLGRVAVTQGLTAALAVLLLSSAVFFILVPLQLKVAGVDLEGIVLLAIFAVGTRLIQLASRVNLPVARAEGPAPRVSLLWAIVGFSAAVVVILVAAPVLVSSAQDLARQTGLAVGFIGVAFFPLITATPELVSTATAVRIGAYDLAVGNLFGSSVFNVFALAFVSLFFGPGSFFSAISGGFAVVGVLGLILISIALLGALSRLELRVFGIEWDALLIILVYLGGLFYLFQQGLLGAPI